MDIFCSIIVIACLLWSLYSMVLIASESRKQGTHPQLNNDDDPISDISRNGTSAEKNLLYTGANIDSKDFEGLTPLIRAIIVGNGSLVKALLAAGASINATSDQGWTPILTATIREQTAIMKQLLDQGANVDEKFDGMTLLDHALAKDSVEMILVLLAAGAHMSEKTKSYAQIRGNASVLALIEQARLDNLRGKKMNESNILDSMNQSLAGLIGLDALSKRLAIDLKDFLSGSESVGRLFYGNAGSGKTEFAQRLSGLREGYPGLSNIGLKCEYISGVDGIIEIKSLVDKLPSLSVVFVDEADKCLDAKAGMVSDAQATQLHHAIVTHFGRKQIYWCFIGTFSSMRNAGSSSHIDSKTLEATVGRELSSRLDFADWRFPDWTIETLLRAVKVNSARRGLIYEDDALLVLAQYCLETGGAVRAFDNIDKAMHRQFRMSESSVDQNTITQGLAKEYIRRMTREAA